MKSCIVLGWASSAPAPDAATRALHRVAGDNGAVSNTTDWSVKATYHQNEQTFGQKIRSQSLWKIELHEQLFLNILLAWRLYRIQVTADIQINIGLLFCISYLRNIPYVNADTHAYIHSSYIHTYAGQPYIQYILGLFLSSNTLKFV